MNALTSSRTGVASKTVNSHVQPAARYADGLGRRYRVSEELYRITPVVMVAQDVPNPAQITEACPAGTRLDPQAADPRSGPPGYVAYDLSPPPQAGVVGAAPGC